MAGREDVCVLVPTYDEAATIGAVVEGFREAGFEEILVVDGTRPTAPARSPVSMALESSNSPAEDGAVGRAKRLERGSPSPRSPTS